MSTKTAPELRFLTREDILGADDRTTEVVEVPEWGGAVIVKPLSGTERDQYEASFVTYRRNEKGAMEVAGIQTANVRARLVSLSVVDGEGKRLFAEKDILSLGDKSAAALERVFKVAQRISALTDKDVEALVTGLKVDPNGSAGSD